MRRMLATMTVLVFAATASAGCGLGQGPKEPTMTPDQAFERTHAVMVEVLEAVQPGSGEALGESDRNVPCGGIEGNEFNKIKAGLSATLAIKSPDLDQVSSRVRAVLKKAGWEATVRPAGNKRLVIDFVGRTGSASLSLYQDGTGSASAETTCLPNPNSDDPHPEV